MGTTCGSLWQATSGAKSTRLVGGQQMQLKLMHFCRPEYKFEGVQQLIAQIQADISAAQKLLQAEHFAALAKDPFFDFSS